MIGLGVDLHSGVPGFGVWRETVSGQVQGHIKKINDVKVGLDCNL